MSSAENATSDSSGAVPKRACEITSLSFSNAIQDAVGPGELVLIVCANTVVIRSERLTVLIDPSEQAGSFWKSVDPDIILISHAHADHFNGLASSPLASGSRIVMSPLSRSIVMDTLLSMDSAPAASFVEHNCHIMEPGEVLELPGLKINAYRGGHCVGNLTYDLRFENEGMRVLAAGEFSLRPIGGEHGEIKAAQGPDVMLVDGHHAADLHFPGPSFLQNNSALLAIIEKAVSESRSGVIFGAPALASAQEVYAACAAFQRAGVAPHYVLYHGRLKQCLRDYMSSSSHFPWDVDVEDVSIEIPQGAVTIQTVWQDGAHLVGPFATMLEDHFDPSFIWALPDYFARSGGPNVEYFPMSTHVSAPELIHLVQCLEPSLLCVHCSGERAVNLEDACRELGTEIRWASSQLMSFKLRRGA